MSGIPECAIDGGGISGVSMMPPQRLRLILNLLVVIVELIDLFAVCPSSQSHPNQEQLERKRASATTTMIAQKWHTTTNPQPLIYNHYSLSLSLNIAHS